MAIVAAVSVAVMLVPRFIAQTTAGPIGGPFKLIDSDSRIRTDRDFRGKWLLIYFGYTHCPDICPTTLADIGETLKLLGPLATNIRPIFITIDPERDTPEAVRAFLNNFDDRIMGLSGSPAEIAAVAHEYKVFYARSKIASADPNSYFMEHTAFVYVVNPDGKYVTLFSPIQGQTADAMAARLRTLMMTADSK